MVIHKLMLARILNTPYSWNAWQRESLANCLCFAKLLLINDILMAEIFPFAKLIYGN